MTTVQQGTVVPIESLILSSTLSELTGKTDILVWIRRKSDGLTYDWNDSSFKAYGSCTTPRQTMTEVDATNYKGQYARNWTSPASDETYEVTVDQSPGTDAANVPQVGEIVVGGWVDDVDAAISSRATPAQVNTECDTALADYDGPTKAEMDAMETGLIAEHDDTQSDIALLENLSQAQSQAAATAALNAYDPPTRAEATADKDEIIAEVDANEVLLNTIIGAISSLNFWTTAEEQQIRYRLGMDGVRSAPLTNEGTLELVRKLLNNNQTLSSGDSNNLVTLDDDDVTPIATSDVTDVAGNPVVLVPGMPARRTRGT